MDEKFKEIKEQIMKSLDEMGISVENIILFGSRARGDYNEDSDYDILIVTEETFPFREKIRIFNKVTKDLAKKLIPCDVIIKSYDEIEYFQDKVGSVVREALQEGVAL